ncbi:hypothetical protein FGIG_03387 [Fasciola gigantica]|uniref:Basement membrane-specific heparan sulfate proteoglycan core protein n=1 Tax=Fasciola gigantica TaxID=46835 RepID=A0A504YJS8_FASGI|nr:hypothetical protein FGIG_03387 [Fasciola gigantica]
MIADCGLFSFGCRMMCSFILVLLSLTPVLRVTNCDTVNRETKHYSITFRPERKTDEVDVQCPLQYAIPGDELLIYETNGVDNSSALIRRTRITPNTKARDLTLPVNRWTDRSQFRWELIRPQTDQVVSRCTVRFSYDKGYRHLVYDPNSQVRIQSALGESYALRCPIPNPTNKKVFWFQHAGYQILHANVDGTLQFSSITESDLGTYFCTLESDWKHANLQLPVRKVFLTAEGHTQHILPVEATTNGDSLSVLYCNDLLGLLSQVTWELSTGNVLVGFNQQTIKQSDSVGQHIPRAFQCTSDHYEESTSKALEQPVSGSSRPLLRTRRSVHDLAQIPKRVYGYSPGESVEMVCRVEKEFVETGKDIRWTFNGGPVPEGLNRIDRLKASILLTNDLQPSHEGHYVCHLDSKTLQVQLVQRPVTLGLGTEPETDTRWANAGESTEFHCRLTGRDQGNKLIDWSFIPKGSEEEVLVHPDVNIERPSATPATSFINIANVQKYHEGTYVCRALNMKATSELVVLTRTLSVNPEQLDARPGTTVRFLCELSAVSGLDGGKLYWMRTDRKDLRPGKEEVIGSTGGRALLIVHSVDWTDHNTTYMCTDGVSSAQSRIFVREACGPGFRSCESGGCVSSSVFCDGKNDCEDGSDENVAKCTPTKPDRCNGTQYICPESNKPIARAFLCDGVADCEPNGEDENECKGGLCHPPMFNDAAWFEDMCIKCYCSGVTQNCRSVQGYSKSSITSYGHNLKFTVRLFGTTTERLKGAMVALHGPEESLYWCPPTDRVLFYAMNVGYENDISIRMNERERWFLDPNCTQRLSEATGRAQFMSLLKMVKRVGIRTNIYDDQTSFELQDLRLEHSVPSDLPGVWVAEIEQCECPPGYEGLSCEKCAYGYERHPTEPGLCRLQCACDECDEHGNCLTCSGNRSGPRCQQCKTGFYRPYESSLADDCIPCDRCAQGAPHVVKECVDSMLPAEDPFCKCQAKEDGKLVDPDCDQCVIAEKRGLPLPEECSTRPEPSPCEAAGTKSGTVAGECECQADPQGFDFDIWLAQGSAHGNLLRSDFTTNGERRLEQVNGDVIVRHPILERGLIHFVLNIHQTQTGSQTDSDIPIYRNLYGGQMSFRLNSPNLDPQKVTQSQAGVVIEIDSPRFGRVWTQATFNVETQRYEVEFNENWWPGGWRIGTTDAFGERGPQQGLLRGQLLRVLGTASSISIVTSSGFSEGLKDMRLSGLAIQLALPSAPSSDPDAPLAPVEVCDCPEPSKPEERALSLSCEDVISRTIPNSIPPTSKMRIQIDHFVFFSPNSRVAVTRENERPCVFNQGAQTLNVKNAEVPTVTSLEMDSEQRYVVIRTGSPLTLVCRVTSYLGGIVTHEWVAPSSPDHDRVEISRRPILRPNEPGIDKDSQMFNQSIHRSEAVISISSAEKSDSGIYSCRASGIAEGIPLTHPDEEKLGALNVIQPSISPTTPFLSKYTFESEPDNPKVTVVKGIVKNPSDLTANQLVWFASNGSAFHIKPDVYNTETGEVVVRLDVPYSSVLSGKESIIGYFVGNSPVFNPYWTPMRKPEIAFPTADEVHRLSPSNFRVDYPLTSGIYLRFQCQPVPKSNLTGEIKFNIYFQTGEDFLTVLQLVIASCAVPEDPYTRVYIYSPDVHIGPEDKGLHTVSLREGQKIRDALSVPSTVKVHRPGDVPIRQLELDWRRIGDFDPFIDSGKFTCFVNNSETSGSKTITVPSDDVPVTIIPEGETRTEIRVLSDDLVGQRIVATFGSDVNLTCAVDHVQGKPIDIKRIDWFMQFSSGRRKKATDSGFAKDISITDNGRHIYFSQIRHKPIGAKIFCVVRPVDTPTTVDTYHPSPMVEFWVREPKWSAVVEPTQRPGVIQGVEAETLHLKCAVTDLWRQKPARNAHITWETRVKPISGIDEGRIPNSYEIPWLGTREDNGILVVGGLRVREEWVGEFRCRAKSPVSNASAESDWVRLEVLTGDTLMRVPKLRLEAESSPEFPYYPTQVNCIDDNEEFPSEVTWTRQEGTIPPLLCSYYGHPAPPGGLQWSVERINELGQSAGSSSIAMLGLRVRSGRHYWSEIGTPKFDAMGRHAGVYRCEALSQDGRVIKQSLIRVELHKVNVRIQELNDAGFIEATEGDNGAITCNAYDGYFDFILPEAKYSWEIERMNGDRVNPNSLAAEVNIEDNHIKYTNINPAANAFRARCVVHNDTARYVSADFGFRIRPTSKGPVTRPDTEPGVPRQVPGDSVNSEPFAGGEFYYGWRFTGLQVLATRRAEGVTYYTQPIDFVVYPADVEPDPKAEKKERERKTSIQPEDNVEYAWEFSRLDGTSIDTGAILEPESGSIELKDNEITLAGIRQTTSVRGRCRVRRLDEDGTTENDFYSPFFRFDVTDGTDSNTRDFVAPTDPETGDKMWDVEIKVTGLDENGYLTGSPGDDAEIHCKAFNMTTEELITEQSKEYIVHYGWEFQHLSGQPATTRDVANDMKMDSKSSTLRLVDLRAQTSANRTLGRCVVEFIRKPSDDVPSALGRKGTRMASKFFLVNVPPMDDVASEDLDQPFSCCLHLSNRTVFATFRGFFLIACIPSFNIHFVFFLFRTKLFHTVDRSRYELTVRGLNDQGALPLRRGQPVKLECVVRGDDGRVRVEVQEIGTVHDRKYMCAAYNVKTGSRLTDVSYEWVFTAANNEPISPGYFFDSIEASGNQLSVSQRQRALQLPEHLRDQLPVEGRCLVLYQPYAGDLSGPQINVYHSNPFVLIHPMTTDPDEMMKQPDPLREGDRVVVYVDGVDRNLVTVIEGGTVTLTCYAIDVKTSKTIDGLSYTWEIQQRDGSSVDTGSLAKKATLIQGPGGHQLTLVGIRPRAAGLRARCVAMNRTDGEVDESVPLRRGEQVASNFFDFDVTRTTEPGVDGAEKQYTGYEDFAIDTLTNELSSIGTDPTITHFGLEARYDNEQSAPFSGLADSITIHGEDGVINLNGLREETKPPTQFRVVVEREVESPEPDPQTGVTRKKTVRIASDYVNVVVLKEDEEDRPVKPEEPVTEVHPIIDGLNRCDHLPINVGENATLICRPNDDSVVIPDIPGERPTPVTYYKVRISIDGLDESRRLVAQPGDNVTLKCTALTEESVNPSYSDKRVRVEISGLNERGQISVNRVGDDASLRCQAVVASTSKPLLPGHGTRYGWEWRYMDEDPVSTTNVAVAVEANGERLGLRGIRAPPGSKGRNVKGRCVVHVPANQVDPSLSQDAYLVYGSDYFTVDVVKKPTTLDPDVIPIPGRPSDGIKVWVTGLDDSGNLVSIEDESVAVACEARNTTTGQQLTDGNFGWEVRRQTGGMLNMALLSNKMVQDGPVLELYQMKPINGDQDQPAGRCVFQRDGQVYRSAYFRIKVASIPKGAEVEGDGRVIVSVKGIDEKRMIAKIAPSGVLNLTCVARDSPAIGMAQLRCRVVNGTETYTSPFYRFLVTDEAAPTVPPASDDRVKVTVGGLDADGNFVGKTESDSELNCQATVKDGFEGIILSRGWEFLDGHGNPVPVTALADSVKISEKDGTMQLRNLRPSDQVTITKGIKGRCVVRAELTTSETVPDGTIKETKETILFTSENFGVSINEEGTATGTPGGMDVTHPIEVIVKGVPDDGVLKAKEGDDVELECEARDTDTGELVTAATYSWEIRDRRGNVVPSDELSQRVYRENQMITFVHLKPTDHLADYEQRAGRCLVYNRETEHTYQSDYFHLDVRRPPPDGLIDDPMVLVKVDGAGENDIITGTPGQDVKLRCFAIDVPTGKPIEGLKYSWELRSADNMPLDSQLLSNHIETGTMLSDDGGEFQVVGYRPTGDGVKLRCVATGTDLAPETKHRGVIYASPIYTFETTREEEPPVEPAREVKRKYDPNNLELEVTGLNPDGTLSKKEGEDVTMNCKVVAQTVIFNKGELVLNELRRTPPGTGGLRSRCTVRLFEEHLTRPEDYPEKPVVLSSEAFVIHVEQPDDMKELDKPTDTKDTPYINWIPGRDTKSKQPVPNELATYGWQLIDPVNDELRTPLAESETLASSQLRINEVHLPEYEKKYHVLWGWCVVDIQSPDTPKEAPVKHYRSKPFKLVVLPKDYTLTESPKAIRVRDGV